MLLADKLEELTHLLHRWFLAFLIIAAARTVAIMLALVRAEQLINNCLELWGQVTLWANELKGWRALIAHNFLDFFRNAIRIIFLLCFFNFSLQWHSFPLLSRIILFNVQKLPFMNSELVLQDSIDDLQSILVINRFFAKMFNMFFLNSQVKIGRMLCRLISEDQFFLVFPCLTLATLSFGLFCLFSLLLFLLKFLDPFSWFQLGESDPSLFSLLLFLKCKFILFSPSPIHHHIVGQVWIVTTRWGRVTIATVAQWMSTLVEKS